MYFCFWLLFRLLVNWGPDGLGSCLILIRQAPDPSDYRLILIWHVLYQAVPNFERETVPL